MNQDELLDDIVTQIRNELDEQVDFIVLFGSMSTGNTHPQSDIDIGVQVSNPKKELQTIFGDLLSLFDFVDKNNSPKIDVTLLNLADLTLQYRVVRDGKLLYTKNDKVWPFFQEYVLVRYPDWEYYIQNYLKQSLGA
ncbi:MAG: nucleotidyltransferase domain-containing protein [Promethearchaeota archaeon]|nr:MAG: nucleotidyltransferase domain-containing protein [Candidatus Lokiarchaeota archaeon]